MENASARNLWGDFLDQHLEYAFVEEPKVTVLSNNQEESDRQLKLILTGKKRAFSHALLGLQYRKQKLPKIGDFTILIDSQGKAKCLLRTVAVRLKPYFSIRESYAKIEGEGDSTLDHWRQFHWERISNELEPYQRVPRESMIIVCEYFDKVFESK